jgi:hypothetical protein
MKAVTVRTCGFEFAGAFAGGDVWEKVNGANAKNARRNGANNFVKFFIRIRQTRKCR